MLIEVDGHREALAIFERLTRPAGHDLPETADATGLPGIIDVVPAAATVLVTFAHDLDASATAALRRRLETAEMTPRARVGADLVVGADMMVGAGAAPGDVLIEIPTVYDGEDLGVVADLVGMSVEEVVRRHAQASYVVAFLGFAPGFAYLVGGDPDLVVPRRATPRPRVPAGSVAIAGEYSAVYPRSSPGGWQLLGRADGTRLWDPESSSRPSLLAPGDRVCFVPARLS